MGQGGDARRELARLGLATSAEKHATSARQPPRGRGRGSPLDHRDRCSTAAASGAPRTRSRATALTNYRLEYPKGLGAAKWKLAYPRAFPTLVTKNTKANQLPEALQLAIMREESAFSARASSRSPTPSG